MRICITRSQKNPYSETFIRNQIKWLSEKGEVFPIYSGRLPEKNETGQLLAPATFWLLHKVIKPILGRNNYFGHYGIKKFLTHNKINIVLANYGLSAVHMLPICQKLGIPLVAHFHGYDATNQKVLKKYRFAYLNLFQKAAAIICVSEDMKKSLIKMGARKETLFNIPCGIDLNNFFPSNSKWSNPLFLTVGRFTYKKAPKLTIYAFKNILEKYPNAEMIMIGGKNKLYDECVALTKYLNIESSVQFKGSLPPEKVRIYMQKAHIFLQHSITSSNGDMEGTPNSILEASASGLPVISTLHGGIKEAVIHGKTGFLVEEKDVAGMSKYMLQLLRNKEQAEIMGKEGRNHIYKNYNIILQINKLFEVLLNSSK